MNPPVCQNPSSDPSTVPANAAIGSSVYLPNTIFLCNPGISSDDQLTCSEPQFMNFFKASSKVKNSCFKKCVVGTTHATFSDFESIYSYAKAHTSQMEDKARVNIEMLFSASASTSEYVKTDEKYTGNVYISQYNAFNHSWSWEERTENQNNCYREDNLDITMKQALEKLPLSTLEQGLAQGPSLAQLSSAFRQVNRPWIRGRDKGDPNSQCEQKMTTENMGCFLGPGGPDSPDKKDVYFVDDYLLSTYVDFMKKHGSHVVVEEHLGFLFQFTNSYQSSASTGEREANGGTCTAMSGSTKQGSGGISRCEQFNATERSFSETQEHKVSYTVLGGAGPEQTKLISAAGDGVITGDVIADAVKTTDSNEKVIQTKTRPIWELLNDIYTESCTGFPSVTVLMDPSTLKRSMSCSDYCYADPEYSVQNAAGGPRQFNAACTGAESGDTLSTCNTKQTTPAKCKCSWIPGEHSQEDTTGQYSACKMLQRAKLLEAAYTGYLALRCRNTVITPNSLPSTAAVRFLGENGPEAPQKAWVVQFGGQVWEPVNPVSGIRVLGPDKDGLYDFSCYNHATGCLKCDSGPGPGINGPGAVGEGKLAVQYGYALKDATWGDDALRLYGSGNVPQLTTWKEKGEPSPNTGCVGIIWERLNWPSSWDPSYICPAYTLQYCASCPVFAGTYPEDSLYHLPGNPTCGVSGSPQPNWGQCAKSVRANCPGPHGPTCVFPLPSGTGGDPSKYNQAGALAGCHATNNNWGWFGDGQFNALGGWPWLTEKPSCAKQYSTTHFPDTSKMWQPSRNIVIRADGCNPTTNIKSAAQCVCEGLPQC